MPANERPTARSRSPRDEIRVRGPIGPTMRQAFPTLAASGNGQDTLLTGSLPDRSALYGVIHQLGRGDWITIVTDVSGSFWIPRHGGRYDHSHV